MIGSYGPVDSERVCVLFPPTEYTTTWTGCKRVKITSNEKLGASQFPPRQFDIDGAQTKPGGVRTTVRCCCHHNVAPIKRVTASGVFV